MTGRNISCLQRAFPGKASTSLLRIMACAIVLSSLFHPGPALAEGCSTPSFAATRSFDAGPNPGTVAVGDFNGDGKLDLATLRSVVLGNGDGTFQAPINHGVGADGSLAIGDFNDDGKADLVVTTVGTTGPPMPRPGSVWVLLGNGDGSFQRGSSNRVGYLARSVAVGDFNGDGKSDLVVANGFGSPMISMLLGKGDGTFQDAVNIYYPSVGYPTTVTVGDLNGDGKSDLAVCDTGSPPNNYSGAQVSVLLGNGDGTFQPAVGYGVGRNPGPATVGDFNGDGKPDLVVLNRFSDNISVLLGNGDGTFQNAVNYSTAAIPLSVAVSDFNGDGKPDLAVGSQYGVVSVLPGNADGTFQDAVLYSTGDAGAVVAGDFNGDDKLDVATPGSLLLSNGDGRLRAGLTYAVGRAPASVAVGDFNRDGKPDLAVANSDGFGGVGGSVSVLLGQSEGTVRAAVNYAAGSNPHSVAVGDFNGDSKPDLAVVNSGSGNMSVLLGQGDGTFLPAVNSSAGPTPWNVTVGDFNADNKLDVAVVNFGTFQNDYRDANLTVLLGNGDGTFRGAGSYVTGRAPRGLVAGDFDGDGKTDLVVANSGADYVSVFLGNGDGSFRNPVNYTTGRQPDSVAVGDLNGDGKSDLAVYNSQAGSVSVLLGNGNGTFENAANTSFPTDLTSVGTLALADFNGDGQLDVAVGEAGGTLSLLLGNGDGTLQAALSLVVGGGAESVAVGDFNGDGKSDLIVAHIYSDLITVLLNTCDSSGDRLSVVRSNSTVTVSWPLPSAGFVFESATSLSLTNWQPAVEALTTNNSRLEVTVPLDQPQRFFRLHKP